MSHLTHLHQAAARLTLFLIVISALAITNRQGSAQVVQPDLLTATSFSVLAGQTVTNTGATVIGPPVGAPELGGSLGVSPGSAVTNFPPGQVIAPGEIHAADAVALQAQADLVTVYNTLAGESPCTALPANIGDLTLTPGIYCFTLDALFTVPSTGLTLDLEGDPDALFVFQVPGQLTTQSDYEVTFINGDAPCNVWWQVGSSATLGTNTQFVGNIVALTSISLATDTTLLPGRALARNGEVTLDTNLINMDGCQTLPPTPTPTNTPTSTPTPPPTPTPVPPTPTAAPTLPPSVAFLPETGERDDNRLPILLIGSTLLLAAVGLLFIRRRTSSELD
jgi:type VI secretion system secreted protein VgrG